MGSTKDSAHEALNPGLGFEEGLCDPLNMDVGALIRKDPAEELYDFTENSAAQAAGGFGGKGPACIDDLPWEAAVKRRTP